jgi:phosphatidylglycerol:prolipoprotein diacylglycerol transferase
VVLSLLHRSGPRLGVSAVAFLDLLFFAMLGVIIGARIGHMLFYDLAAWIDEPLRVLRMWEGGMSFHGGALGVALAVWAWSRKYGIVLGDSFDALVPLAPLGIACGRLGNFINGELYGTPSTLPWAMIFPLAGDSVPRHPTPLYEMAFEGVALFALVWWFAARPRPRWAVCAVFALGYAAARLPLEFLRAAEPGDAPWFGWFTQGQRLTLGLALLGALLLWRAYARRGATPAAAPTRA